MPKELQNWPRYLMKHDGHIWAISTRIKPRSTTASDLQGDRSLCRCSRGSIRIKLWRVHRLGNLTKMPTNGINQLSQSAFFKGAIPAATSALPPPPPPAGLDSRRRLVSEVTPGTRQQLRYK
ncbi:uncharacterized protein LOC116848431 [Odontomachus brunneus]|uniref:uncharacterized protein LOC116848431 n=1 Tax=Odontomachus brunneus TaxID=486640 RepID=UPI0013F1A75D|nr:uncharacterized protein LOC116848431 [Odontomachus brunneus]XP_032680412.1 uncharacterized protein LOC116848431 [Odontomachus brunneus]XP_032680414.1 uncharacterized protein LOC116848431 [Odontomachus brunneus]